ncbi:SMI1/KNR4 family protein [Kitasatospora sp. NPDC090091]|uniref:SMI1/KNR4 family protein n=1 Tax=Kitasatospora sp. NPDC090091 TaxID=3364081 RepID=UPI003813F61B
MTDLPDLPDLPVPTALTGSTAAESPAAAKGPTAAEAVAVLRRVAAASGGLVTLDPGIEDARLDAWPVVVPEEIRVLLRSVGGVRMIVSRSPVNGFESIDHVDLDHAYNHGHYAGGSTGWYLEHAGGPGTHWFVFTDHGDGHVYVDVDRESGAWGPVFMFWDATDTVRVAPSLSAWLHHLARCLERALAESPADDVRAFGMRLGALWPDGEDRPVDLESTTAAEVRVGADPLLRAAAAELPDDARLVDLRSVTGPVRVEFDLPAATCRYGRHAEGSVLTATPWDGE